MKTFEDPDHPGNSSIYHTGSKCIESDCNDPAGTWWNPYWCFKHNVERMNRISKGLEEIMENFNKKRLDSIKIGQRIRSKVAFSAVPKGTDGIIDEDYGSGFMIAWDLPNKPLPKGYSAYDGKPVIQTGILRDGFDKETEFFQFIEIID